MVEYYVTVGEVIKHFSLDVFYMPEGGENIRIIQSDVNRAGIQLTGFFKYSDPNRIQLFGKVENSYMKDLSEKEQTKHFDAFFAHGLPALILTRGFQPYDSMLESAKKYNVPIMGTSAVTSNFISALIGWLNVELAPRETLHGVLVEVYGEGILLLGDSGVGKSETAIELVKRGHRLIADDAVEIKKVSEISLVGSAPEIIRHYVEIRGIGVVDIRRIFGMGAVKLTEKIELVIELEQWDNKKEYDRLGIDTQTKNILGVEVPMITVPVKPGRNLAIIIEIAAMNNRQKVMGYNAALELNEKLEKKFNSQEIL